MDDRKGPSSNHDQVWAGVGVPKTHPHFYMIGGRILCPDLRKNCQDTVGLGLRYTITESAYSGPCPSSIWKLKLKLTVTEITYQWDTLVVLLSWSSSMTMKKKWLVWIWHFVFREAAVPWLGGSVPLWCRVWHEELFAGWSVRGWRRALWKHTARWKSLLRETHVLFHRPLRQAFKW